MGTESKSDLCPRCASAKWVDVGGDIAGHWAGAPRGAGRQCLTCGHVRPQTAERAGKTMVQSTEHETPDAEMPSLDMRIGAVRQICQEHYVRLEHLEERIDRLNYWPDRTREALERCKCLDRRVDELTAMLGTDCAKEEVQIDTGDDDYVNADYAQLTQDQIAERIKMQIADARNFAIEIESGRAFKHKRECGRLLRELAHSAEELGRGWIKCKR